ncbi:hypothetical protein AWB76_01592 [Caballeronia temeraria]|uniref:Uncharacterized protein n=1 Tax=Caballeronia temeraria TaxID=1777137 RepID=A0A158A1K3_9BURK|nr:hypothetical protein AWB76_01592 [Caballeronia temeraria]
MPEIRSLPSPVTLYTGDDFNYPDLVADDDRGFSHALRVTQPAR